QLAVRIELVDPPAGRRTCVDCAVRVHREGQDFRLLDVDERRRGLAGLDAVDRPLVPPRGIDDAAGTGGHRPDVRLVRLEDRLEARPEPDRTLGQERDALRLPLLEIGPVAPRSRSRPISRIGASSRTDESALSRGLLKTLKTDNGSSGRRSLLTMAE